MRSSAASRPTGPKTGTGPKAAPKPRSLWDNLVATNEEMGLKMARDTLDVLEHPLSSLGHMAEGMAFPLLHPLEATRQLVRDIRKDPLDGTCDAVGTAAGEACIVTVLVAIGALAAAPFTGGASLALATGAMAVGNTLGLGCVAADAGGILLHEVRGAEAKTAAQAKSEGDQTASYAEDEALTLGTWNASNWFRGLLGKGPSAEVPRDVAGNIVGSVGVYDAPPARFNLLRFDHPHAVSGQVIQNNQARRRALAR